MMNANLYSTWCPETGLSGRVIVEKITDDDEGLSIFLRLVNDTNSRKCKLIFDPYVAYRNLDESYRNKTFSEHGGFENSLNLVENSSWLAWLHTESQGYYAGIEIKHYAIITDADFIDVLTEFPPEVEWIS